MNATETQIEAASSEAMRSLSETEIEHTAGGFFWLVALGPLLLSACVNVDSNNGSGNGNGKGK